MSLDKVAFLQFNVLIAEEISSVKKKNLFVSVMLFFSNCAWMIIVIRNITFTRLMIKNIYTKIRIFIPRFDTTFETK